MGILAWMKGTDVGSVILPVDWEILWETTLVLPVPHNGRSAAGGSLQDTKMAERPEGHRFVG